MASWLVIDWDQEQFHILQAQTARGGVHVTHAATWAHPEPLTPSTAERVGKALRDFLKAQKIPTAPVIVGLGRDRVFLKELRIPPIAAHEEASLVRFQTGKEMAEAIDNYAVDYTNLSNGSGERHIMTVAGRRDLVSMSQTFCQAAGLKLHALTPKVFGSAAALERAIKPDTSPLTKNRLNAVLTVGQRWAELCFFRGNRLLQAQALANGPLLAAEVKRNLAVFGAQHAVDVDVEGPDTLYVFGDETAISSLRAGQPLPITVLDPLKPEPAITAPNRAAFAGGVGLAELWSAGEPRPVNLSAPKRQQAPISVTRKGLFIGGAAAAVLAVLIIAGMVYSLSVRKAEIVELSHYQTVQKGRLAANAQERADLDAYKEWEQSSVRWLDEIYDLSARYPFEQGFRVNQLTANTTGAKKNAKDKFIGTILLGGVIPEGKNQLVTDLFSSMARDSHLRADRSTLKVGADYTMSIDVSKQELAKYDLSIDVPIRPKSKAPPPPVFAELKLTDEERAGAELIALPMDAEAIVPDDDKDEKGGGQ